MILLLLLLLLLSFISKVRTFFQIFLHLKQNDFNWFSMLLLVLSPKLLNFTTYLQLSSLLIGSKWIRSFTTQLIHSHTQHFILVIPHIFGHSYFSSIRGQLIHRLSSHLVTLSISLVSKLLVNRSF